LLAIPLLERMQVSIIIPFYNEAAHLKRTLNSFVAQQRRPDLLLLVNDSSTDESANIALEFTQTYPFIKLMHHTSEGAKTPGTKVINAFNYGLSSVEDYDLIGKFDADIVLPPNYFESCITAFEGQPQLGMFSGLLHIRVDGKLRYESIANKDHVRGPLKLYSKRCFQTIGGLVPCLGWDSIDSLLAEARGFDVRTNQSLIVEHLRPTSNEYANKSYYLKRGESFYRLGYDFFISLMSALKMAWRKRSIGVFILLLLGYRRASQKGLRLVDDQAQHDILRMRYKKLWRTLTYKMLN
jgi:glycosyltransferase involved in cell wall biosynthesis